MVHIWAAVTMLLVGWQESQGVCFAAVPEVSPMVTQSYID